MEPMTTPLIHLIVTPLLSFALAAFSVRPIRSLAMRCGAMATPAPDCRHREPTPLFGGLSIVGATLLALGAMGHLPLWFLFSGLGLLAVGLVDDVIVLTPMQKLAAEIVVAVGIVLAGPGLKVTSWVGVDAGIVIFWLLATSNSFNLIDGLDGLASGIGVIASAAIATAALLHHELRLAYCALALAGALTGFLIYNFHPASIFMGDGGALPVGLLLGVLSLRAGGLAGNSRLTVYVFPILVMLVPLLDTAIVSVTRLATGRAISRRGLDHSHHRLLALGLSDRRVVVVSCAMAAIGAAAAVATSILPHAYVLSALPFLILAAALPGLFMMDLTFDSSAPGTAYGYLPRFARFMLSASYKWRLVDFALDAAIIAAAYFGAFLIRLDFHLSDGLAALLARNLPWVLVAAYPALVAVGIYRGIWRYIGLSDAIRFANGAVLAGILLVAISLLRAVPVSGSIIVLFTILLFNLLVASRVSFQLLRKGIAHLSDANERVLIVGAGQMGLAAARDLSSARDRNRLIGFVDDDAFKRGKLVEGEPVLGSLDDLDRIYEATPFDQIVVTDDTVDDQRLGRVWSFANRRRLGVRKFSIQLDEMSAGFNGTSVKPFPISLRQSRRARS
jgi:UDP-GlcNAc:undecaprenyl-phosphate/decaprenyl-phosphate GlcNAc-1-phosphate transferase